MSVLIEFHMDTSTGNEIKTINSPFDDRAKAADKIKSLLEKASNSSSPMMRVRDSNTGDYVFVHTMKLANVVIRNDK